MENNYFNNLVEEALSLIPQEFKNLLENVVIVVDDVPSREQMLKAGRGNVLLGLYEGIPKIKRGRYGIGGQTPDKITIFKRPIEYISRSPDEIVRIVRETVVHEIAHHFGMNEEELERLKR